MFFFFSSRRRHTRCLSDWSSDVCSSDLAERQVQYARVAGKPVDQCLGRLELGQRLVAGVLVAAAEERRRSEERRVGKECSLRGLTSHQIRKQEQNVKHTTRNKEADRQSS